MVYTLIILARDRIMLKISVICSMSNSESFTYFHKVRKQFFTKKCNSEYQLGGPLKYMAGPLKLVAGPLKYLRGPPV